ncbi:MAG: phospho-N-acetylmuramoyl-pentapeptide-transferase [Burkholderiales bacterium]|jgi:phospho-N-acetylmuramoyl-pentapeptide-transferase|nr:phospho-N-acetylmuramoyl-pentapeptide-transferase [Burkholderiales bacterium]
MFVFLSNLFEHHLGALRLFDYVTFRALVACLFSLLFSILVGERVIAWLTKLKVGQSVRDDGPQTHLVKTGTPTMGGVLIIISVVITDLIFADLFNPYIWLLLFVLVGTGTIGFIDDYRKIVYKNSKGLSGKKKMIFQALIAFIAGLVLLYLVHLPKTTEFVIPFFKGVAYPFGTLGFLVLTYLVICGSSNAVNLTDGLDGLVSFPVITVSIGLGIFAYVASNKIFASHLLLPHVPGSQELVVFSGSLIGSCLGFLWFNAYPARVFMGDVGSLAIGAALGTMAIIVRQEIAYAILAGLFVMEAVSVIMQVGYFKMRRKRIFLMAPIHHHFELKGWKENQVVVRFWVISIVLLLLSLSTIKLR